MSYSNKKGPKTPVEFEIANKKNQYARVKRTRMNKMDSDVDKPNVVSTSDNEEIPKQTDCAIDVSQVSQNTSSDEVFVDESQFSMTDYDEELSDGNNDEEPEDEGNSFLKTTKKIVLGVALVGTCCWGINKHYEYFSPIKFIPTFGNKIF